MVLKGKLVGKGLDWPSEFAFSVGRRGREEGVEVEADRFFFLSCSVLG